MPNSVDSSKSTSGISPDLLLSIATVPLLGGILVGRAIADVARAFGQASEEIFRGDRLPVLKVEEEQDSEP